MSDTAAVLSTAQLEDCRRIRDVARTHGFAVTMRDARAIWVRHSADHATSWLVLPPGDAELVGEIVEPLHKWMAENDEPPPPVAQKPLGRPMLVDENQDGPCEVCAAWAKVKYIQDENGKTLGYRCDECGEQIPEMGVMRGRGFSGIVAHHYHLQYVGAAGGGGAHGRKVILQELCPGCYFQHRRQVYPHESAEKLERNLRV